MSVCSVSITVRSLCLSVVGLSLLESVSVVSSLLGVGSVSVSITVRSRCLSVVCLSLLGVCDCL